MGGDDEYGGGDVPDEASRDYRDARRGYGSADSPGDEDPRGRGRRGYGQPQPGAPANPPEAGRGYGGAANPGGAPRGYGDPQPGGNPPRGYGAPRGYDAPVDAYTNPRGGRGRQGPIPGEVIPGDGADGTRQFPNLPGDQPTRVGAPPPGAAPRRSRLEERQAARSGTGEYAPGQERSSRYGPSVIDGRSTRNGAGRPGTPGGPGGPEGPGGRGNRPVRKVGYHRYFDYPRTGKYGWQHWVPSLKQVSSFMLGGFFLVIGLIALEYATVHIPTENSLVMKQSTNYTYDDGTTFASQGVNRKNVQISDIPDVVQNAIIAAEDKTFKTNPGISYTGIIRAVLNDVEGKPLQGASTLTQQFVKNAYLTQNQTFSRKLDEIFIALKIGHTQSKSWVMQNYLNTVFFGRGSYGIQAASQAWLGKDIDKDTDPADAALLAALVNEPTNFSKGWDSTETPDVQQFWQTQLKQRWKAILDNMLTYGTIDQTQHDAAVAAFPAVVPQSANGENNEQQQMQTAVRNWIDSYGAAHPDQNMPSLSAIEAGGYTVVTTFNSKYMAMAQKAVQDQLLSKLNPNNWYDQNLFPALAAVDPTTGELVAFYGGTGQFNWATQGQVQPGSTFKAFTLATAFKQNISPNSMINGNSPWPDPSNPTEVAQAAGDPKVTNDDGSHGMITINTATADSVNTAFVRLASQVTYKDVLATANSLGINDNDAQGLRGDSRLTLGDAAVSPARMASAYSTFANNGSQYPLIEVKEIKSGGGQDWKPQPTPTQSLDSKVAQTVTQTLTHVTHDPGATGAQAPSLSNLNNIAGKTGTSTMDLTSLQKIYPDIYAKTQSGRFTTAATWWNGYTTKLEAAVSLSRWVTEKNPRAGQPGQADTVQVQAPVDNINGQGFSFGAQYPLAIWSEFMKQMQTTNSKFVGDPAFPVPDISGMTVVNSPSPSATPSASASASPSSSASTTPSPSTSSTACANGPGFIGGLTGGGNKCPTDSATPSSSASSSPSPSTSTKGTKSSSPPSVP